MWKIMSLWNTLANGRFRNRRSLLRIFGTTKHQRVQIDVIKKNTVIEKIDPWHFVGYWLCNSGNWLKKRKPDRRQMCHRYCYHGLGWQKPGGAPPLYKYFGLDKRQSSPSRRLALESIPRSWCNRKSGKAEQYTILKIKVGRDNDERSWSGARSGRTSRCGSMPMKAGNPGRGAEKIKWLENFCGLNLSSNPYFAHAGRNSLASGPGQHPIIADEAV